MSDKNEAEQDLSPAAYGNARARVHDILGGKVEVIRLGVDALIVDLSDAETTISYVQLAALVAALGTTDINLKYEPSEPDWSDVTPGDPSHMKLIIRGARPVAPVAEGKKL